jgi:hypothetical protein
MNKYVNQYNLRTGDEIIVPKSTFNIIQHHALYLGIDENGTAWIIENVINIGVRLISTDDFFKINPTINEIRTYHGSQQDRHKLIERALNKVGTAYDLFNYNCQHFTSDLLRDEAESKQVQKSLAGLVLFFLIGLAIGK